MTTKEAPLSKRRWLTLQEKIKAGTFYQVRLKDPDLREPVVYEVEAHESQEAIKLALKKHDKLFDFGSGQDPTENVNVRGVSRYHIRERTDEEALDFLWEIQEWTYLKYWDAEVTTKQMLHRIERKDIELYNQIKYYSEETWSSQKSSHEREVNKRQRPHPRKS